jgi:hypothetical protein
MTIKIKIKDYIMFELSLTLAFFAIVCYFYAESLGRSGGWGVVGGLLFGFLAVLYYLFKGKTPEKKAEELLAVQAILDANKAK